MTVNPGRGLSITDEAALDKMIKNSSGGDYKKTVTEAVTAFHRDPRGNLLYNLSDYGCPYKKWIKYNDAGRNFGYCYDSPTVISVSLGVCKTRYGKTITCLDKMGEGNLSSVYRHGSLVSVTGCPAGYTPQSVTKNSSLETVQEGYGDKSTTYQEIVSDWFYFCQKN